MTPRRHIMRKLSWKMAYQGSCTWTARFAGEDWCRGFTWWKWDQDSPQNPDYTREQVRKTDFTIRGKKAEGVFRLWAGKGRQPSGMSSL